jgi:CitMHS family citrate-Mg2+:H+ or citrate-Ca2+:H+ symporter
MVVVFMFLIMTKRLPALVALIIVPIVFGLIGGFGAQLGPMMLTGIKSLAPTGVMLMFAILYFGIMIDAGLFDPVVRKILKLVQGDPMKIVVGTAALAMFVSLDGDGATTYMITVSAMLPLYKRLGMSRLVLACVIMLAGGVFNILPWGGPTARAASALGVDVSEIFVPMILPMAVTVVWVLFVAYVLGKKERKRLGTVTWKPGRRRRPAMSASCSLQAPNAGRRANERHHRPVGCPRRRARPGEQCDAIPGGRGRRGSRQHAPAASVPSAAPSRKSPSPTPPPRGPN